MKIVFLNTWAATQKENLEKFIKEHISSTDIFCLQEVDEPSKPFFLNLLTDFKPFYTNKRNKLKDLGDLDLYLATYIKKGISVNILSVPVLQDVEGAGLAIYTKIKFKNKIINVCNLHGQNRPGTKQDTSERLEQSRAIINFFESIGGIKIIGGDFNLMPGTKSIKMLERAGYINLIKKFNIRTTRNRFAWEENPKSKQYFADYVFVSSDFEISNFEVIENEVSDHLPMVLEFLL